MLPLWYHKNCKDLMKSLRDTSESKFFVVLVRLITGKKIKNEVDILLFIIEI